MPTTPTSGFLRAPLPGAVLLRVTGADRISFLHRMLTCEVKGIPVGRSVRGLFLTQKGKVVADFVLAVRPDRVDLLAPPAARGTLRAALSRFVVADDVAIEESVPTASTFVGPEPVLPRGVLPFPRTRVGLPAVDVVGEVPGEPTLSAEGLEVLRVEAGEPLLGAEATEETLPQECGFDSLVSYTKGCFLGQEPVARLHAQGHANRGLAGILLDAGAAVPERGTPVFLGEKEVGRVTSAVLSKALGRPIALAILRNEAAVQGTPLALRTEQGPVSCTAAGLPFVR